MDLLLDLTARYREPHRHYHTLEHVAAMLHAGRDFPLDDEQTLAVWFHDAIYDPRSTGNEADSAALARVRLLAAGWSADRAERVARIVLDTSDHRPSMPASAPVLDLDLMSLAAPWERFLHDGARIRREYSHVDDATFAAGRRAFFTSMLARERLYHTAFGAPLEARARANLTRALAAP
jgi:predicted metal-dependent HD superfamily phosphohydrolase